LENFLSFFPFWIMMKINLTFLFWRRTFLWGIIHKKIFWGVFILMELLKKFEILDRSSYKFYIYFKHSRIASEITFWHYIRLIPFQTFSLISKNKYKGHVIWLILRSQSKF
jgi:hypothetical protein